MYNGRIISQCNWLPYSLSFDSAAIQIQLINHSFKKNLVKFEIKSQITFPVNVQSCSQVVPSAWPALENRGGPLLSEFYGALTTQLCWCKTFCCSLLEIINHILFYHLRHVKHYTVYGHALFAYFLQPLWKFHFSFRFTFKNVLSTPIKISNYYLLG